MFDLFTNPAKRNMATQLPGSWAYVRRHVLENIAKYKEYYNAAAITINAEHPLVSLVSAFNGNYDNAPRQYADYIRYDAARLERVFGLTSEVSFGRVGRGQFFGPDSTELIVSVQEEFDPEWAEKNWTEVEAVKVLRHPYTTTQMPVPFADHAGLESGLTVIAVDLPKLAMMYRGYYLSRTEETGIDPASVFLPRYVWPNLMPSYLEHAWFNRVMRQMLLKSQKDLSHHPAYRLPFPLPKYSHHLGSALDELEASYAALGSVEIKHVLANIPCMTSEQDAFTYLKLPDVVPTTQIAWAMDIARLHFVRYALDIQPHSEVKPYMTELTDVARALVRHQTLRNAITKLPSQVAQAIVVDEARVISETIDR